jgi:Chromo (CHRromatin Organisation MOdifier) domain
LYTVERILEKKKEGRRSLYLIKWDGFDEKEATWEPLSNLGNVKEMVKEFDRLHDPNMSS